MKIGYKVVDSRWGKSIIGIYNGSLCYVGLGDNLLQNLNKKFIDYDLYSCNMSVDHILHHINNPNKKYEGDFFFEGTHFQKKVWSYLLSINSGKTISYGDLAKSIKEPTACRAVALACGQNPIAIIVPCHRVVSKDDLGGYHWGIGLKQKLLDLESQ